MAECLIAPVNLFHPVGAVWRMLETLMDGEKGFFNLPKHPWERSDDAGISWIVLQALFHPSCSDEPHTQGS